MKLQRMETYNIVFGAGNELTENREKNNKLSGKSLKNVTN